MARGLKTAALSHLLVVLWGGLLCISNKYISGGAVALINQFVQQVIKKELFFKLKFISIPLNVKLTFGLFISIHRSSY